MGKEVRIILVDTGSESNHIMMSDIAKLPNAIQISNMYDFRNKFLEVCFKIHFGFKLNRYFDFPFKSLWDKKNILKKLLSSPDIEYYLILSNDIIRKISNRYLEKISGLDNVHTFVLLLDSYDFIQPYFKRMIDKVKPERVYSFQESDCHKYGFNYTNMLYSKSNLTELYNKKKSDFFFVGADKRRINDIYEIYKKLIKKNFDCKFIVIVEKRKLRKYTQLYKGIDFRINRVSYRDILNEIASTRCILELCQKGQDGLTMRFYEAIFYNKYLLTNNITAMNHELFNSEYMVVFSSPTSLSDDELDKLKFEKNINYCYKNEMSPIHLVEQMLMRKDLNKGFLK